jgi:hypothetical protein
LFNGLSNEFSLEFAIIIIFRRSERIEGIPSAIEICTVSTYLRAGNFMGEGVFVVVVVVFIFIFVSSDVVVVVVVVCNMQIKFSYSYLTSITPVLYCVGPGTPHPPGKTRWCSIVRHHGLHLYFIDPQGKG